MKKAINKDNAAIASRNLDNADLSDIQGGAVSRGGTVTGPNGGSVSHGVSRGGGTRSAGTTVTGPGGGSVSTGRTRSIG